MSASWNLGRQRALAGRTMPEPEELRIAWGLSARDRALFRLGYLEGTGRGCPPGTREAIEQVYLRASDK